MSIFTPDAPSLVANKLMAQGHSETLAYDLADKLVTGKIKVQEHAQALKDEAAIAAAKAYDDTAKSIDKSLADAIFNLLKKGKSLFDDFKMAVETMFKNLVLKPIQQPISNALAGMYQQGSSYVTSLFGEGAIVGSNYVGGSRSYAPDENPTPFVGSFGNGATPFGGWSAMLAGAAVGGAVTSQYGSRSAIPDPIAGAIVTPDLVAAYAAGAAALTAGATAAAAATTAFAAAAAAVPVIGWIVAAILLIASFVVKPGGGPKVGSFQSANYVDGVLNNRSGWNFSGGGDNKGMNAVIDTINTSYVGYVKALGGKLLSGYSLHSLYETDPQGTASSYGMVIAAKPGQGLPGNGPGQADTTRMDTWYNSGLLDPTAATDGRRRHRPARR